MRNTFALVVKLYSAELPFLRSFIYYYLDLGIDRFYFIDTSPVDDNRIAEYISQWYDNWKEFITLERHTVKEIALGDEAINLNNSIGIYNTLDSRIEEEWTIVVDTDEYLYFGDGMNVEQFIQRYPAEYYWFPWVMVVSDEWEISDTVVEGYEENTIKYMVRTKHVSKLRDHTFYSKRTIFPWNRLNRKEIRLSRKAARDKRQVSHPGICIHYWAKGIKDVLLKSAANRVGRKATLNTTSYDSSEDILKSIQQTLDNVNTLEDLPKRLKILADHSLMPQTLKMNFPWQVRIDYELLNKLLYQHLSNSTVERLIELYHQYKEEYADGEISTSG